VTPKSESCRSRAPLALGGEPTTASPACELASRARPRPPTLLLPGALMEYSSHSDPDLESLLLSLSSSGAPAPVQRAARRASCVVSDVPPQV
jgi:hypothetical protein